MAQTPLNEGRSAPVTEQDTTLANPIENEEETSTFSGSTPNLQVISLSGDSLDAPVIYEASDSMIYDIVNEKVYLYGNAKVTYESMTLSAAYVEFNYADNIALAEGMVDSTGQRAGNPVFKDKDNEFEAYKLRYNFKSQKGKVYDVRTQEGDGYLLSESVKFDLRSNINKDENDVVYADGTMYTTCDADHPHFGIKSTKAKIIPNKLIVVGPSNLQIADVPTPLWLPFGFFPIQKGQRSGIIFPRDYEFSPTLGFGLRNIGYYFGISDYFDLTLSGDIYTRGSWGLSLATSYNKRYKSRGNASIRYSHRRYDARNTPDFALEKDFLVSWNHSQAPQAHPSRTFNASMNFGTGSFLSNNNNDARSVLTNTMRSNISLNKTFPGKPFSLSTSFQHSQNTRTRLMTINFPVVDFRMNQIFPFQRKIRSGKERWYEKIGFSYTSKLQNQIQTVDTLLFTAQTLEDMQYGIEHNLPVSASFRIFKYFNLSPSVTYNEKWYLETIRKDFDPTITVEIDTIYNADRTEIDRIETDTTFGKIIENEVFGFKSQRLLTSGLTLSTQIFGTANFKKGKLKAIRHVVKPSINASYTPDYTKGIWNYFDEVQTDTRNTLTDFYSFFDEGIYSSPPRTQTASLGFNIGNTIEAKVRTPKDTLNSEKKITLLNSFNIRGNYNFAADSLKMSTLSMTGNTRLFKVVNVNFGTILDPYTINEEGRTINRTVWKENKRLFRFRSANLILRTRLDPRIIQELFGKGEQTANGGNTNRIQSLNFSYNLRFGQFFENGKDTIRITTNSITLQGTTINLTSKWRIRIGNIGYDFVNKRVTYPDFGFYRDLHCWEMGMDWQPERRTYSFFIRVKPSSLDFLSVPYRRNRVDPFGF